MNNSFQIFTFFALCAFGSFGQEVPVHIWPAGVDSHIGHSPTSGLGAVDAVYISVFYSMGYCVLVFDAQAA